MMLSLVPPLLVLIASVAAVQPTVHSKDCRNVPGSPDYPSDAEWQTLRKSVSNRLVPIVPSGQYCRQTNCTDAEWTSANWRNSVPGAMCYVNFEQDYESDPPSLCGRTEPETCGQGNVPLYAILAESAQNIQAGVNFARNHNLRLSVKASGHDLLGRSTSKNSLLIHTHKLNSITFTDHFRVGSNDYGSAVTVGSGVGLGTLYDASREMGKIYVGGYAATVVPAGGYVQGGGYSFLSLLHGLSADNVLEFNVVTSDGAVRRVNEAEHPDLFWAMRGGGPGSWGVTVNATFKTYPTFNATWSTIVFTANDSTTVGAIAEVHARHVFDFDLMNGALYFVVYLAGPDSATYNVNLTSVLPGGTFEQAKTVLSPLLEDILDAGGVLVSNDIITGNINEMLTLTDDLVGQYGALGSRLIPESSYRQSPESIGEAYKQLLDVGSVYVGNFLLGGKVAENADIDSAVIPGWRTAKAHLLVSNAIPEQGTIEEVHAAESLFRTVQLPILETIQGPVPAAYSNEADVFEDDWQTIFYGPNYSRLSTIKSKYDPTDLFIVRTGVGSERWDHDGLCKN